MVYFGESNRKIKINGKIDKTNTYNGFSSNISFFTLGRTSSDKKKINFSYILAIEEIHKIMMKS